MCHLLIACLVYYLPIAIRPSFSFFFFNDTATTEIYPLSLHDALPILGSRPTLVPEARLEGRDLVRAAEHKDLVTGEELRSEEHTSELQSPDHLVCRLLLEKKKIKEQFHLACHYSQPVVTLCVPI